LRGKANEKTCGAATREAKLRARASQRQKSQPRALLAAALQGTCAGYRAITRSWVASAVWRPASLLERTNHGVPQWSHTLERAPGDQDGYCPHERMTSIALKAKFAASRRRAWIGWQVNNHAQRIARLLLSCLVFVDRAEFCCSWLHATVDLRVAMTISRTECMWVNAVEFRGRLARSGARASFFLILMH
jgi:hypothetical protein